MQTMEVVLDKEIRHRQLMLKVSHGLGDFDLEELKYFCGVIIGEAALEEVKSAIGLFKLLQYHGKLGPSSYNFLKTALSSIQRKDLAMILPKEEKSVECSSLQCDGVTGSECEQKKYRMMLVAVADRMRRKDIIKLMFLTSSKVKLHDGSARVTDDAIGALQVLAGLEKSSPLCSSSYSSLSDYLQQIGRHDLAEFVMGFPASVPQSFTAQRQALGLMMEVLRNRRKMYIVHHEKLSQLRNGNQEMVKEIHSILLGICEESLRARTVGGNCAIGMLQQAFHSQYQFQQCTLEHSGGRHLKHMERFDFMNDVFHMAQDHETPESRACQMAESAQHTRTFIFDIACEIIGKEKSTKVYQLNEKIENGIDICSGYGQHISSLLSCLASLLSSARERTDQYRTEFMDIFINHKNYLMGAFPMLATCIQSVECLADISKIPRTVLTTLPATLPAGMFRGHLAMVMVPSYAILLNLLHGPGGQYCDTEEVLQHLLQYLNLPDHITGTKEFIERCATAMCNHLETFQQEIMDLDKLCAPLITELIKPSITL
jgi:hypothetical protein